MKSLHAATAATANAAATGTRSLRSNDRIDGRVAAQGKSATQIHGVFSIHGADHEMAVPAEVQAHSGQYAVTVNFSVPYVKWGMKNPSTLFLRVNDKVEITVRTVAHIES